MSKSTKNYRKFIAAAATATIVASVVAPMAFAASFTDVEDRYQDAVQFLVSKGIKGTSETTFGTQFNIKRVDAAVFVAKALELDTENAPDSGFTDVPERAQGAVNALKEANITSGKTTTTFASDQEITRGELAIWLQRAFKLEAGSQELAFTDVADRYESAVKALVSNKITNGTSATTFGTTDSAKRGDFALFIKRAVDATTIVEVEPAVESVNAINAKQVEVKFTQPVNTESVIKDAEANTLVDNVVTIDEVGEATDYGTLTGELSEDGKTLTLTASNSFDGRYSVTVVGVEDQEGTEIPSFASFFNADDVTRPTVTGVSYEKGNKAKVTFSEPIKEEGTVTLNGTSVEVELEDNYILVPLTTLDYEEAGIVNFVGVKDFAGNLVSPNPVKVNVERPAKDEVKPVVNSVKAISDTRVEVVFSEELGNVTFTVNDAEVTTDIDVKDDKVTYILNVELIDGVNKVVISDIEDLAENKAEDVTRNLVVALDEVAPTLENSKVLVNEDGNEYLELTFSEAIVLGNKASQAFTGTLKVDYVTKNDQTFNAIPTVDDKDDTKVIIPLQNAAKGSWTLTLGDNFVKDLSKAVNGFEEAKVSFVRGEDEAEAADIELVSAPTVEGNKITLTFNGELSGVSAIDETNYSIEGATIESASLTNNSGTATVVLTLEDGSVELDGEYELVINGVKAADGSQVKVASQVIELKENVSPTLNTATLVNGQDIELTFSEAVKDVDITDFILLLDGKAVEGSTVSGNNENGFTLSFGDELNSEELAQTITIEFAEANNIKDTNDNDIVEFEELTVVKDIK